ncbi:MAG: ABC transporter permease [Solirubrobacteraceae bacterium]
MSRALHAEWTKLRTLHANGWLLLATVALFIALSAVVTLALHYSSGGHGQDITKLSLAGIYIGQAIVAILAVVSICSEYSTGMIAVTLTAIPRRASMLAAKAITLTGLVVAAATLAVLGSMLASRLVLPGHGFTPAHGYAVLSLTHALTLRAAGGSVLYLALIALLSLGVATAVREAAVAVGIVLGLLYLFPILAALVTDPSLRRHLQQIAPMNAGLAIQDTTNLRHLPIAPWAGLGVLAAWAAVSLIVGALLLHFRDA